MKIWACALFILTTPLFGETKPLVRNKFSRIIGWKNHIPQAPRNFEVSVLAKDLKAPRWIYQAPNGDLFIAETKAGQITFLRDANSDGVYEVRNIFLKDLNRPFGMLIYKNWFYVATSDALYRYPYKSGESKIETKPEKLLSLPDGGHHTTRNILYDEKQDKIFISVGSASNIAEYGMEKEKNRAAILECTTDGKNLKVLASGLRNPVGMAINPITKKLWTTVNERDNLGDDLVPDFMTEVKENGFYGWPYSYLGKTVDTRVKDQRPDLVATALVPDVDLGSHTASLGLTFYTKNSFPTPYHNGAFVGQHGSWNRSAFSGYKVVFVPFKDGKADGRPVDFLTGFIADEKKNEVYGRPVGVTVLEDGSLAVADDGGDVVWKISYGKEQGK